MSFNFHVFETETVDRAALCKEAPGKVRTAVFGSPDC